MSAKRSKSSRKVRAESSVSTTSKPEKPPTPRSTWEVSTQEHANFAAFPNEDWEAATHPSLRPAVCVIRGKILEMAGALFDKLDSYVDLHGYRARRLESIIAKHVDHLQRWIAADASLYAGDFRRIAAANAEVLEDDPLNWAYAQIYSTLHEFLKLPRGDKLRDWLMCVCDGEPKIDEPTNRSSDLISIVKARLKAAVNRAFSWRAPVWLYAYLSDRPSDKAYNPEDAWSRLNEEKTNAVFAKFVLDFWMGLESSFAGHMQNIRVVLAQQGKAALRRSGELLEAARTKATARKRKVTTRPQDRMVSTRRKIIRLIPKEVKGDAYCKALGAKLSTPISWQKNEKCPKSYNDAYWHSDLDERQKWRARIWDERYKACKIPNSPTLATGE